MSRSTSEAKRPRKTTGQFHPPGARKRTRADRAVAKVKIALSLADSLKDVKLTPRIGLGVASSSDSQQGTFGGKPRKSHGSTYGNIPAPSQIGFSRTRPVIPYQWKHNSMATWVSGTTQPSLLLGFKSATQRGDHKAPTGYTRMISKLTPGGSYHAFNGVYQVKGDTCGSFGVAAQPYGCDLANGSVWVPQYLVDKVVQSAIIELQQIDANVLEDLGQLQQTGKLLVDIFETIVALFASCLSGHWAYAREQFLKLGSTIPRRVANGWLMYYYGIRPLVSSFWAIAMSAGMDDIDKVVTVLKRASTQVDARPYVNTSNPYHIITGTVTQSAQCQLTAHITMSQSTRSLANLGITGSDIDALVTAWALVPYSFVVDWVLPVERWLRSLSWSPNLKYSGGFVGRRHKGSFKCLDTYCLSGAGPYPYNGSLPQAHGEVTFYRRTPYLYTVPLSNLTLRLDLNSTQIINALALITQRM